MLADVVGTANAGPQRYPRELGLQPGGHLILGCRHRRFRIPCQQLAGPRWQLVRHRFVFPVASFMAQRDDLFGARRVAQHHRITVHRHQLPRPDALTGAQHAAINDRQPSPVG